MVVSAMNELELAESDRLYGGQKTTPPNQPIINIKYR